jgi:uncharacterized protein (TIGR02145 family)
MKTRKILAVIVLVLVLFTNAFSQSPGVAINTDGATPHASAMLDVSSTAKGFLPPRMTNTQKNAIVSPVAGLLIWCSNCGASGELQIYNGTTWTNFVGGAASAGKPDAPTIGTATVSGVSGTATISFTAPVSNGGSAITSYTATSSPGGLTTTLNQAGSGTITFTGLTNGTAYTFTVTATTVSGTGSPSAPSNSVTPCTVPGAPTIGTATARNAQATITFTAPASNGGSAITSYTATSSPGGFTGTISQAGSGTITITGLTIGTAYTFIVKATNAGGAGAASAASNSVIPFAVPGAPTIGTATAGNAQATVIFTAPASNGGSAITSYTATSSPGGIKSALNQAGSGTITFTGLTNGTAYTFTVTATNSVGTGAASAPSNSVTPFGVPGAPTIGTATAGNAQANVIFTAPVSNGGSVITSYTATSSPGGIKSTLNQAGSGTITFTGLTNGTAYTFTVKANNTAGTGAASAASNSVIPFAVPGAPTIGTATAGNAQATVIFTAPASNGGSAITSYTATSSPGGFTGTISQAGSGTITITGLSNGTAYTFKVKATNVAGAGPASAASNSVTPIVPPITDGSGNTYETVLIGTQTWMTKNLNTSKYSDGTAIPNITDKVSWNAASNGAYCDYNNTASNSTTYGKLYNWFVVDNNAATKVASNGGKNICPVGWHVPTSAEWTTLVTYLGDIPNVAVVLKQATPSIWKTPNTGGATNTSGFAALPGGGRFGLGTFGGLVFQGVWWTTSVTGNGVTTKELSSYSSTLLSVDYYKQFGFSVRCLKD